MNCIFEACCIDINEIEQIPHSTPTTQKQPQPKQDIGNLILNPKLKTKKGKQKISNYNVGNRED